MGDTKITIVYKGTTYEVCEWAIEEANRHGLEFDDEYIAHLLENENPYWHHGLDLLAHCDILNRILIGSNGLLGRVIKLHKNGTILEYFESVFDASMDALNGNYKYTFEKLHESGVIPSKESHDFFGITIKTNSTVPEQKIIAELNKVIRRNRNRYLGKRKIVQDMYTDEIASRMTYEEYVLQGMRSESFAFAYRIHNMLRDPEESKYTRHTIESCADYDERINALLKRYSLDGTCAFEKVDDLNKLRGFPGIYLLCLPQIKGCYVGKTEHCFATRITQHFTTPNSEFDKKYNPTDIKGIYVLQMLETLQIIDFVEEDCIATLGKEICLNALAGGNSALLIKSESYDESQHLLDPDLLRWVTNDALLTAQYRRDCAADDA